MKISISKKIMMMVLLPILFICIVVAVACTSIMNARITDEIEEMLKVSAYNFKVERNMTTIEELDSLIQEFKKDNDIDVTIFENDIRAISTVDGAVGTAMDKGILNSIEDGEHYFATNANVNGEAYFGYYIPIMDGDTYIGASFTGIPRSEATYIISQSVIQLLVYVVICGIIAAIVAIILVKKMVKGITTLENTVGTLLNNDLSVVHAKYAVEHDEIETICNKTVDFSENLNQIISKIKASSVELKDIASDFNKAIGITTDTSNEISRAVEEVAHGAVSQAEETTNATHKMTSMSEDLGRIKINAIDLHNLANSMDQAKNNALNTLSELQTVNGVMADEINSTSNQVNVTNESVQKIKAAVQMIQDIAEQTKLLALNASIEAARAGEHGRGFAVVAEEISKLASQSTESSTEIEQILVNLADNYSLIIDNVNSTTKNMSVQNEKLSDTQQVFTILEEDINGTVERIESINTMVEGLDMEIRKMVDVVANLSSISEENSASTEQTMASIQELNATIHQVYEKAQHVDSSADELMNEVNVFKTE